MKGTILVVGPKDREAELLALRLEKEHFNIEWLANADKAFRWLKSNVPQAALLTRALPLAEAQKIIGYSRRSKKMQRTPVLSVATDNIKREIDALPGMGETLLLHQITLADALRRLELAIQLKQIVV